MYHYLTGAASWYMMTMMTEVFGVHGEAGDMVIRPKLLKEQFDENKTASIRMFFAGKEFAVSFQNREGLEYGTYKIGRAECDGTAIQNVDDKEMIIERNTILAMKNGLHNIIVELVSA